MDWETPQEPLSPVNIRHQRNPQLALLQHIMSKKRTQKVNEPLLFTNEELGIPPEKKEYRGTKMVVNKHGQLVRVHVITKTKEQFVKEAREVWGDAYDYTESVYENGKKPITIYCPKHDHYFTVPMAQNHLIRPGGKGKATGCPICRAEITHHREYGKDWRNYLHQYAKNNRVGKNRDEVRKRKYKRRDKKQAEEKERINREKEAFIKKWNARNYKEARFIEKVHAVYGDQYDTALVDYKGKDVEVSLICREHGLFTIKPRVLLTGEYNKPPHGCWKCCGMADPHDKTTLSTKEFYRRINFIYRNDGLTFKRRYKIKLTTRITGTCKKHGEITHKAQWWLDGKGCEYCNGKFWPADWIKNAQTVHGDKYQYVGEPPRNGSDFIHYICKEHGLIEQRYDVHVRQGCECPYCKGYTRLSLEERRASFVADFHKKHGYHHFLIAEDEYVNNDTPITVTCLYHNHTYKTSPDNLLRGAGGCMYCSCSDGEATILGWLDNHGIAHQWQYQIPNEDPTLPLQYVVADFYLSDYNGQDVIIEFNGEQHYQEVDFFYKDSSRNFDVQQHRDQYLRDYCQRNNIRLIEISYTDQNNIDEILQRELLPKEYNLT